LDNVECKGAEERTTGRLGPQSLKTGTHLHFPADMIFAASVSGVSRIDQTAILEKSCGQLVLVPAGDESLCHRFLGRGSFDWPEITCPVANATPTILPETMMAFAAWQRGQTHGFSAVGPSGVHSSIKTFDCP
jgi:hypothetical protein